VLTDGPAALDEITLAGFDRRERAITPGLPPVGMPCGVADDMRLGLGNTTANDAFGQTPAPIIRQ
jgi:hypothetical protein